MSQCKVWDQIGNLTNVFSKVGFIKMERLCEACEFYILVKR